MFSVQNQKLRLFLFPKSEIKCIFRSQINCSLISYDIHLYMFNVCGYFWIGKFVLEPFGNSQVGDILGGMQLKTDA